MSIFTPQQVRSFSDRLSSRADLFQEAFIDSIFDNLPDVFNATVLSDNNPSDSDGTRIVLDDQSYILARIRPTRALNRIYPDPLDAACLNIARKLINMHPQCVFEVTNDFEAPNFGDEIECRRIKESNGQKAVLFATRITKRTTSATILRKRRQLAMSAFADSNSAPSTIGESSTNPRKSTNNVSTVYTLQQYKDFVPALTGFLDDISSHETGRTGPDSYDAYNCGATGECNDTVVQEFGRWKNGAGKLSTKTIAEIRASQNKRSAGNLGVGVFAVGRYQLVGSFDKRSQTFQETIAALNIDQSQVFNKEIQDAMGAYLILSNKRPALHGYMVDKHDDAIAAAHAIAEEWASYPSQYGANKGQSVYKGVGNNAAAKKDSKNPEGVAQRLRGWKNTFLSNAKVKEILGI